MVEAAVLHMLQGCAKAGAGFFLACLWLWGTGVFVLASQNFFKWVSALNMALMRLLH